MVKEYHSDVAGCNHSVVIFLWKTLHKLHILGLCFIEECLKFFKFSAVTDYKEVGIFVFYLCFKAVDKELSRLMSEQMSDRKLKAAKKQLLGQLAVSGDNGETQCLSMGKSLMAYGKINSGKENKELIEAITAEDLRQMAQEIFSPERLSRLIYI